MKTISDVTHATCNSFMKTEILKHSNGMLFQLSADVRNGSNRWDIHVWSTALCQWNVLVTRNSIPGLASFDYYLCMTNTKKLNPLCEKNWHAMKSFVDAFASNL